MPSHSEIPVSRLRAAPPTLVLKCWPPRHEPLRCFAILGGELVLALLSVRISDNGLMGLIAFGLLFVASWQWWAPLNIELGAKGIIYSVLGRRRRIAWTEFSHYELQPHGAFLWRQPDRRSIFLPSGLFLPAATPQTELISVLEYYLKPKSSESLAATQTLAK